MPGRNQILGALWSLLLLQACSTPGLQAQAGAPSKRCDANASGMANSANCRIEVDVSPTCQISWVDPAQKEIDVAPGANLEIWWQIRNSPGFKFSSNGIAFKPHTPPSAEFSNPTAAGVNFHWTDTRVAGPKKTYEYSINIENGSGSVTCSLDPKISNL